MANGIGSSPHEACGRKGERLAAMANLPSETRRNPRAGGRKSLVPQDVGAMLVLGNVSTESSNGSDPVLSRAAAAAAPAIRSPAGLFRRRPAVGGGRPTLRIHSRRLSGTVPRLPPWSAARLLRRRAARAAGADQEGARPPADHRLAQAEPV